MSNDDDDLSNDTNTSKAVPVTILSGFLGSGKTTLLNYILTQDHGYKIAVIENEFGEEIGIESLVAKEGQEGAVDLPDFYELSNGCICCTVRDDLVETLERLLKTRRNHFDYILVETTGMANLGAVASTFWVDDELEGKIVLDGIVTVVDSKNFEWHLSHKDATTTTEAQSQVAYADRILINKADLIADEEERAHVEEVLNSINSIAPRTWTERGAIDLGKILNIGAFNTERAKEITLELSNTSTTSTSASRHTKKVSTFCVKAPGAVDLEKLNRWIGELLWENEAMTIFRIKGVLRVDDSIYKHVLQGVHDLFECSATSVEFIEADTENKIVFIGQELDLEVLQSGFNNCILE